MTPPRDINADRMTSKSTNAEPPQSWSKLSLKIACTLMALGMLCATGLGAQGFLLLNFFLVILLGRLSLQWLETTRLFRPLEGLPTFLQLWWWWEKRRIPSNLLCSLMVLTVDAFIILIDIGNTAPNACSTPLFALLFFVTLFLPLAWNILYFFLPLIDYFAPQKSQQLIGKQILVNCFKVWLVVYAFIAAPTLTLYQCSLLTK